VIAMIALPVVAVTAADVLITTVDVSGPEGLDRRIGAADASVSFQPGHAVVQDFDPDQGYRVMGRARDAVPATLDTVAAALGRDVPALERRAGRVQATTDHGVMSAWALEVDLEDPLADGLVRVAAGRLPHQGAAEVVVNQIVVDRGLPVGSTIKPAEGKALTVVGVVTMAYSSDLPVLIAPPGALDPGAMQEDSVDWLIGGGPVSWAEVQQLNEVGALALSREVITNPPPLSALSPALGFEPDGQDKAFLAVLALVVTMALLEIALLAGPAFAVSARQQARSLALVAAAGGTPAQARRAVLAGGIVLGGLSAMIGVVLGLAAAWLLQPVAEHYNDTWLGPFDVRWSHVLAIALFAVLSAVLAAAVPAVLAARQDVVAVLAGRRGDPAPSRRSPVVGIALVAAGIAGSAFGARQGGNAGIFAITAAAVVAVIGAILLMPLLLALLAALMRRLRPRLPLRFAVRDAARHRTRTVPAVAAVMATVAGVVALAVAFSSDQKEYDVTYVPLLAMGKTVVTGDATPAQWRQITEAARRVAPESTPEAVRGFASYSESGETVMLRVSYRGVRHQRDLQGRSSLGSTDLVASSLPTGLPGISAQDRARADRALAAGGIVVFVDHELSGRQVRVRAWTFSPDGGKRHAAGEVSVPGTFIRAGANSAPATSVSSPEAVAGLDARPTVVGLYLGGRPLTGQQEQDLTESLTATTPSVSVWVERGPETDQQTLLVYGILFGLGAVLMLGGTLTATFLALSDARPDLATLAAVGAEPRARRSVAASYALVVGLVGSALGAGLGLVPGIAASFPLTGNTWATEDMQGNPLPTHYLDIPWLLIVALVLALPLVTAAVVWLSARSRLPMVARLQ